jgi:1,4-dihydroxy-2-naphthoate octaprenyltransferase
MTLWAAIPLGALFSLFTFGVLVFIEKYIGGDW